jgi:hypothetical protein
MHVLGATATTPTPTLSDLRVNIPIGACPLPSGGTSATLTLPSPGLTFSSTGYNTTLTPVTATAITGVWPTSDSALAFITYTGSGGVLPAYTPAASGQGQTAYIKLSGAATAPITGVVSADNSTFYAGTSGDNLVHIVKPGTTPGQWSDSSTLAPKLTTPTGTIVPVDLMVQKPRRTT